MEGWIVDGEVEEIWRYPVHVINHGQEFALRRWLASRD